MPRFDGRANNQLRPLRITPNYLAYAEGSALIETGDTHVLCAATIEDKVPPFLAGAARAGSRPSTRSCPARRRRAPSAKVGRPGAGAHAGDPAPDRPLAARAWSTCPPSASARSPSIATSSRPTAARAAHRSPAPTSRCTWPRSHLLQDRAIPRTPIRSAVAAVSVGIVDGAGDARPGLHGGLHAWVDFNVVMLPGGRFVEVQGTAEREPFSFEAMTPAGCAGPGRHRAALCRAEGGAAMIKRLVFVDGYNLIRNDPTLSAIEARSLEAGRGALVSRLIDVVQLCRPTTSRSSSTAPTRRPPCPASERFGQIGSFSHARARRPIRSSSAWLPLRRRAGRSCLLSDDGELRTAGAGAGRRRRRRGRARAPAHPTRSTASSAKTARSSRSTERRRAIPRRAKKHVRGETSPCAGSTRHSQAGDSVAKGDRPMASPGKALCHRQSGRRGGNGAKLWPSVQAQT